MGDGGEQGGNPEDGAGAATGSAGARPEGPALHQRSLDIQVFDAGDAGLTVRSRLTDRRPWHPDPRRVVLHDMELELDVELATMVITGARATMHSFPHAECPLIAPRFADLTGISIARGFTRSLREIFGGVSGCSHLHELARATGPAVVQARIGTRARRAYADARAAAAAAGEPIPTVVRIPAATDPAVAAVMHGTCHLWADDGIGVRKIAAGWRPNPDEYPAPSLDVIEARARDGEPAS